MKNVFKKIVIMNLEADKLQTLKLRIKKIKKPELKEKPQMKLSA